MSYILSNLHVTKSMITFCFDAICRLYRLYLCIGIPNLTNNIYHFDNGFIGIDRSCSFRGFVCYRGSYSQYPNSNSKQVYCYNSQLNIHTYATSMIALHIILAVYISKRSYYCHQSVKQLDGLLNAIYHAFHMKYNRNQSLSKVAKVSLGFVGSKPIAAV